MDFPTKILNTQEISGEEKINSLSSSNTVMKMISKLNLNKFPMLHCVWRVTTNYLTCGSVINKKIVLQP